MTLYSGIVTAFVQLSWAVVAFCKKLPCPTLTWLSWQWITDHDDDDDGHPLCCLQLAAVEEEVVGTTAAPSELLRVLGKRLAFIDFQQTV